jgi:hypothetical protein
MLLTMKLMFTLLVLTMKLMFTRLVLSLWATNLIGTRLIGMLLTSNLSR